MTIDCTACPLRKNALFSPMTEEEVAFMRRFKTGEMTVTAGTQLLLEGSNAAQLYTCLSGHGLRYKTLSDGRRQVVSFVLPGDFIGLQASVMGEMHHSVESTTDMTLCVFNRADIWTLFKTHPARAFDLTFLAAVEEHFLGESLATVGQKGAFEKLAWSLHRFFTRADAVGLVEDGQCPLPYRQQDLADALGLSLVHTNKTLSRLRGQGLADWSDGRLTVPDVAALAEIGLVDETRMQTRPLI
ncbi:cyclic nucleotide-binding protein (plasmid) [Dinoroseobacter shibae DFL 12 = DSM 16493]|jgi:CRP-like cAMP-binding protein|uniref:Cyclic nucleotide-binding protein n=1 Tax=Dinoroseobacter shibae (strain DSM 16493 / NCIMB 14021 / DFL 12) TaxID=398580 RepID=A8LTK7_DINSH|nr:Crp/Fnr family transcriptional regulator [Dinoroseobacter shibae]ABV95574.1 cyclic nucleotide-binding protein [Dinoroseobacter shibae DFL 12 = DSM 16493]URF48914.1 Crp/Fnr family transcriptional regulator [Dinoroseobacter shibae]URF53226.1 Crp/Fnr family transcriptional regulator [Dinoroseobacter shibae]